MECDLNISTQIICKIVLNRIKRYNSLLLAFSGGLDSTVLLDILTTINKSQYNDVLSNRQIFKLRVVHINHGLNQNADNWVSHCIKECMQRNITPIIKQIVLNTISNNIEEAARKARYHVLSSILLEGEVLLTAQHKDDQTETVLLALKRGSGPAGLASMASDSPFYGHRLIRPLLEISKSKLEAYAQEHGLCWIEDSSNNDLRFDRNFLRIKIIPALRQRWPEFVNTSVRSARLCAEQEQLLDELLANTIQTITYPNGSICLKSLIKMSDIKRRVILRRWLNSHGLKMPSYQKLEHLWKNVVLSRRDSNALMQLDNQQIRRFRDRLYVLSKSLTLYCVTEQLHWPKQNLVIALPGQLGCICRKSLRNDDVKESDTFMLSDYDGFLEQDLITNKIFNNFIVNNNLAQDNSPGNIVNSIDAISNKTIIHKSNIVNTIALHRIKVRAPSIKEQVSVRFGSVGGLLYITGRNRGRALKKIWQEFNIPPWQRKRIPMIFYNNKLIAAIGVFITCEGEVQQSKSQWILQWYINRANLKDFIY